MSIIAIAPPMFRARAAPITIQYVGSAINSGLSSGVTGSVNFGVAAATRYALAFVSYSGSITVSSLTILGVAATQIQTQYGPSERGAVYLAAIPAGGTGNVVVALSANAGFGCTVDCYRIDSPTPPVMVDSEAVSSATLNYTNSGIVVPPNGGIVAAMRSVKTGSGVSTFTWTGLTEDADAQAGSASRGRSAASAKFTSGQNPLTIGVNGTITPSTNGGSFIAVCLQ